MYPLDGAKSHILVKKTKALQVLLSLQFHVAHMTREDRAERVLGAKLLFWPLKVLQAGAAQHLGHAPVFPSKWWPASPELLQPGIPRPGQTSPPHRSRLLGKGSPEEAGVQGLQCTTTTLQRKTDTVLWRRVRPWHRAAPTDSSACCKCHQHHANPQLQRSW